MKLCTDTDRTSSFHHRIHYIPAAHTSSTVASIVPSSTYSSNPAPSPCNRALFTSNQPALYPLVQDPPPAKISLFHWHLIVDDGELAERHSVLPSLPLF
jgi:hypothetical protein